ncbi:MAG: oligopeptide transporter, OPT family [Steroidobacteraceae bacterium]
MAESQLKAAPQLTLRAVFLGVVLAALMAAANTYLGLFAGMTIASAIPSAVVSMAVLKLLGGGGILENNIVQTGGSAGSSTATGVIFTTPALVILGFWSHYSYGWVFAFAALGGVLGVLFTVPLRRALIVEQKLRFPEGTAAAEVLRAGANPEKGAKLLALSAGFGALMKLAAANGLRLIPDSAAISGWMGKGLAYLGTNLSAAMLGVGYICGLNVGIVIVAGGLIAWDIALPIYTSHFLDQNTALAAAVAGKSGVDASYLVWSKQIRYIGVGAMLVGGLWTLFSIRGALVTSVRAAMSVAGRATSSGVQPETERDLPLRWMLIGVALCTIPLLFMYHSVVGSYLISIPMTLAMIVLAFIFCAVSAYMTGLVGGSNDPVSGMIIATILSAAALLLVLTGGNATLGPVAALMVGAAVCCALCTASDNLQDLKAGQLVGATPWRQQLMLAIGVLTSSLVLAPVLNLLAAAYGIGVADAQHPNPLIAPQAVLLGSVAKGLFGGVLPWNMVIIGLFIGIACIVLDEWLRKRTDGRIRSPVLAVAVGVYLPLDVTMPILLGGLVSWWAARSKRGSGEESMASRGMLFAAGMVAGESLMGVLIAIPIVLSGRADVLALPPMLQFTGAAGNLLGLALLGLLGWGLYRAATRAD